MRDVKNILLTTDFSENSRTAFPAAIALSRRLGAQLHLLHVVTPLPWPSHRVMEKKSVPMLNDVIHSACEKELRRMAAQAGIEDSCQIHVVDGSPAEQVERFVTSQHIDLLAISTKGHTGLKRFMLGSTAEKVARTAPCPVLVVRSVPASWDKLSKIVVSTDFSELSDLAIEEAVELARSYEAEILLLHVAEETDYPTGHMLKGHGILDLEAQTRKAMQQELEGVRREKIEPNVPVRVFLHDGVPSATIADLAEEEGADCIVISSHGREGLARFFVGSTAERVVRIAPCSVLVVKERDH